MTKIKTVHIISGLGRGGAEAALCRLLNQEPEPNSVMVISLTSEGVYADKLIAFGVDVRCLGVKNILSGIFSFFALIRLLWKCKPQIVQTWMYHADLIGGLAAYFCCIPVCWGIRQSNLDPKMHKFSTMVVARACAFFSALIPKYIVSCSARAIVEHKKFGYKGEFVLIPNGINLDECVSGESARKQARSLLGLSDDKFVFGHVGRSNPQKDHENLFKAFSEMVSRHPAVKMVVVGEGLQPGNAYFQDLLNKCDCKNQVLALGPRGDILQLLPAFDLFVLSSLGEAFPNVVVEAMACGVSCAVTDVGDAADIVGETGWVVPPRRPMALADAMERAYNLTRDERFTLGIQARQRIEQNYTLDRMYAAYFGLWDKVVKGRE